MHPDGNGGYRACAMVSRVGRPADVFTPGRRAFAVLAPDSTCQIGDGPRVRSLAVVSRHSRYDDAHDAAVAYCRAAHTATEGGPA